MALTPGTRLGVYEITVQIGEGGMGAVYRATDTSLSRQVAIKVLPDAFAADPDRLARFEREAKTLASLNHPHIAAIYAIEKSAGVTALVMELVDGEDLSQRIAKGAIPLDEALPIAKQIAEALEAAHEQGIIHRDLKPANIKVRADGTVKVLDFGLAKAMDTGVRGVGAAGGDVSQSPTITTPAMTQAGIILGTAAYMAPEQARGRLVDRRADIWAFGCVLLEMLTGRCVFAGADVTETLARILTTEPDLATLPAATPEPVRRLVRRSLEKERSRRLDSAADARLELEDATHPVPAPAIPPPPVSVPYRMRWAAWATAAMFLLTSVGLVMTRDRARSTVAPPVEFVVLPPAGGMFTGDGNAGSNSPSPQFALSPDGRSLAFVASSSEGHPRLWVRSLDSLGARPLPGTEGAAHPFWSPDSRSIGFFAGAKLKVVAAAGGPVQVVCDEIASPRGGTWSRDNTIVFARSFGDGLYRVAATGGRPTPVTRLDPSRQELSHRWPEFLPDDHHFLFLVMNAHHDQSGIYLGSIDSTETTRLVQTEFRAEFAAPGSLFFVREGTLFRQGFDVTTRQLMGTPVPVAEHVGTGPGTGEAAFATSSGALALSDSIGPPVTQLTWFDRGGQPVSTVGTGGEYENVALSPDNQRIAAHRVDPTLGTDVWVMDAGHRSPTRFTFDAATDFAPAWSPDGRYLAFSSNRTGTFDIFRKLSSNADREEDILQTSSNGLFPTSWSPDGRFLLYTASGSMTGFDVWVLPLFGDRKSYPLMQTGAGEGQGQFSSDGKWVAYTSDETGTPEVFVQPFPTTGAKWQVSAGGGSDPRWRRDGRELYYMATDGRLTTVPIKAGASFEIGTAQALFLMRTPMMRGPLIFGNFAPATDGQRFLVNTIAGDVPPLPITVVLNWSAVKGQREP